MTAKRRALSRLGDHAWTPVPPRSHSAVLRAHPAVATETSTDAGLTAELTDSRTGLRHQLNLAASVVWVLLDGQATLAQIADEVADAFALPAATASEHVLQAARQFWEAGLLDGSPPPPVPEPVTGCSSCA